MIGFLERFLEDDSGATALEYGLMLALISMVVVGAATAVFGNVGVKLNKISNTIGSS
ncbi:MAG: Flp family type IVb pilin [Caulobacteraceae bacterium]